MHSVRLCVNYVCLPIEAVPLAQGKIALRYGHVVLLPVFIIIDRLIVRRPARKVFLDPAIQPIIFILHFARIGKVSVGRGRRADPRHAVPTVIHKIDRRILRLSLRGRRLLLDKHQHECIVRVTQ